MEPAIVRTARSNAMGYAPDGVPVITLEEFVGPEFEEEACKALKDGVLEVACPWAATISSLRRGKALREGAAAMREADVFGYFEERDSSPCPPDLHEYGRGSLTFLTHDEALTLPAEPPINTRPRRGRKREDFSGI